MIYNSNYHPKKKFIFTAVLITALILTGCSKADVAYTKTDFYFDTVVTVTVYDSPDNKDAANAILEKTMQKCARYDHLLSPSDPESDISRINSADGKAVEVSDETAMLLYSALSYCDATQGLVDITIKPVKDMWHFDDPDAPIPSDQALTDALLKVDYKNVLLDGNEVTVNGGSTIDLGFIAKGFIADKLKNFLVSEGCKNAIINLGGNVQTIGNGPDGNGYSVGIQKPFADLGECIETVTAGKEPHYSSAVTSGIYERYVKKEDKLYHHILDTKTGFPAETDLDSVTILTDLSTDADALSTACLIMGSEKALEYLKPIDGVEAVLIKKDGTVIRTDTKE